MARHNDICPTCGRPIGPDPDTARITRRQREIYDKLLEFGSPPTIQQLADAVGLKSRGSMHSQLKRLQDAGLVLPMNGEKIGVRLADGVGAMRADMLRGMPTRTLQQLKAELKNFDMRTKKWKA